MRTIINNTVAGLKRLHGIGRALNAISVRTHVSTALAIAFTAATASGTIIPLISPTLNNGSFETISGKTDFTTPVSGSTPIPYWGATLLNASGASVPPPSDSGVQSGGNVVEQGSAGSFFQPGGNSTAFNLSTNYVISAGDQFTLTWWAWSTGNGGQQVVTLFSQSPSNSVAPYVYNPVATLVTADGGANTNFNLPTTNFEMFTLTYTATAADAGNYIGLTVGNSAASYTAEDNFNLQVLTTSGSPPIPNAPIENPASASSGIGAGVSVTLTATAGGSMPISFVWQTDGGSGNTPTNIPGATSSNLVVNTSGFAPGTNVYDFVAINSRGTNTSPKVNIVVVAPYPALPALSVQFGSAAQTLAASQVAGFAPEEFWNVDSANSGIVDSNLLDSTGIPTSASVKVTYGNGQYHTSDSISNADGILMSGGFWSGSGFTVNVTGVTFPSYNVFVYMLNDHPSRRYGLTIGSQTYWGQVFAGNTISVPPYVIASQTTEQSLANQVVADLVIFTNITGGSFTLNGQTPDGTVAMMGMQVFDAYLGPPVASAISVSPIGNLYSGLPVQLSEIPVSGALPLSYKWLTDNGQGGAFSVVVGATNSTLQLNTANFPPGNYSYEVILTNSQGSATSAVQTITIASSAPILVNDISSSPTNEGYAGQTVTFSAAFAGTLPITYQWLLDKGSGPIPISTANNPTANTSTLVLSNLQAANAGTYSLTASNAIGGPVSSSSSTLTVVTNLPPSPTSYTYGAAVLANHPLAYWPLDDTDDPSTGGAPALDASGNGYYGIYAQFAANGFNGILGPEAPQFPGFPTNNGALQTTSGQQSCFVSASAGTLTASNLTYVAWINPNAPVGTFTGILIDRGAAGEGLGFGGLVDATGMAELGYTWNRNNASTYNFNSQLFPTANQWNFVAMVIQPTQATLYLIGTNGVVQSTNNVIPHDTEEFGVAWHIGNDFQLGDNGSRVFPGSISSVSVYLSALSSNQIVTLADIGLGITPPAQPVTLHIARSLSVPGSVTITWPQNGTLLQATNVTGPWTTNTTATSPYTVPATGSRQFFRLISP